MEKDPDQSHDTKTLEEGETESKVFEDELDENLLKGGDLEKWNDDLDKENSKQRKNSVEKASKRDGTKVEGTLY